MFLGKTYPTSWEVVVLGERMEATEMQRHNDLYTKTHELKKP